MLKSCQTLTCRAVDLRLSYADNRSFLWSNRHRCPHLNPLRLNDLAAYQLGQYCIQFHCCRHRRCRQCHRCRLLRNNRLALLPPINSMDGWPIVSNAMIENRISHRVKHHHRWIVRSMNVLLSRLLNRLDIVDFQLIVFWFILLFSQSN